MDNDSGKKPFDVALRELEEIVAAIEKGTMPLEVLMEKYEQGMKLHAECQQALRSAELRIEELRLANGKPHFDLREIATDGVADNSNLF
ncbi:MAG: exodeoxyribonuclease VII small subunit [Puniceicoccales bacterium]|jgi:exodeoxyribonuclease VII small subunit|nr:exodeoxyribonuclease VII small subunit [Puniceicoccales bacterium]